MPWEDWSGHSNPDWWRSYNNVKHQRDVYFHEATLRNAINALGALLLLDYSYYSYSLSQLPGTPLSPKDTTQELHPESTLLRLPETCYYAILVEG
jgi:hypothetical protein